MGLEAVNKALSKLKEKVSSLSSDEEKTTDVQDLFCFEDTILTNDLNVTVKDVGHISFPLSEDVIKKIITVSSKAKFGQGEATVLDTQVRDTQMIPASDLTVDIDKECLENLLTRAKAGLNLTQKCTLEPHLHNMLVYGPGQFFKMHKDSEKVPNMVATLVIVLPSVHKGGDLLIQHNNSKHIFFGSQNAKFTKCIAFYADCLHEIQPVIAGYRVAITYNIVLKPSDEMNDIQVNDVLNSAVKSYFPSEIHTENPQKLVYALNHEYSEANLKWGLLKGQDRTQAFALLAVAKKQNLIPCLALGKFKQSYDIDCKKDTLEEETTLDYWVDEWNVKFLEDINVDDTELCFLRKTQTLFKPYKSDKSFTGNAGTTVEHWYRRAFVVLWSNKWDFFRGYKDCLLELHRSLHTPEAKEVVSLEEIRKIWSKIYKVKYWKDLDVVNCLVDLVIYLNDSEITFSILSQLSQQIMQPGRIDWILKLEDQYDDDTWLKILKFWTNQYYALSSGRVPLFVEEYLSHPSRKPNSLVIKYLSEDHVQKFLKTNKDQQSQYYSWCGSVGNQCHKGKAENLWLALKMCYDLGNASLENELIQHVLKNPISFQPKTIVEFFALAKGKLSPKQTSSYKCLRDAAIECLGSKIAALANANFWEIEKGFNCHTHCGNCPLIQTFLRSKNTQKYCMSVNGNEMRHIAGVLKHLVKGHHLVITTDNSQKPPIFIIEKGNRVFQENQKKEAEFKRLKNNLEKIKFPEVEGNVLTVSEYYLETSPEVYVEYNPEEPWTSGASGSTSAKRMRRE